MENPIESLPFANASPVVPAMPVPVCLNAYCKGFFTKTSIHRAGDVLAGHLASRISHPDPRKVRRVLPKKPASLRRQLREYLLGHFVRKVLEKRRLVTLFVTLGRRPYAMVVRQ
jgi:hypothetical protein